MFSAVCAAVFILAFPSNVAAASAGDVTVTIRVRGQLASQVPDAYVALVPAWRPSRHPLAEGLTKNGVAAFRVPVGTYLLMCGAKGSAIASQELPVPAAGAALTINLSPLETVSGIVTDAEGKPLAGVRVARVNGAVPAPLGTLSELAVRQLGSDWSATTDATGKWNLGLPDGALPLLFDAPGRAAEWRVRRKGENGLAAVSLGIGSRLQVTMDRTDPDMVLTVSTEDAVSRSGVPADEQPLIWARWAKNAKLSWDSLPPGVYGIYAKYPEPRYFMQSAKKLASVTLAAGEERNVDVILPPAGRKAGSSLALFLPNLSRSDLGKNLTVFGRGLDGKPVRTESFVEEVIAGSALHIKSEGLRAPFYATTDDRFFSAIPSFAAAQPDADAAPWFASIRPRSDVYMQLRSAEESLQIPRSGTIRLPVCEGANDLALPVEIHNGGSARFAAPAGCPSLLMELEAFEPVVVGKMLSPGDQELGEFLLHAASSADIHVVRDPSGASVPGASVRIVTSADKAELSPVPLAKSVTDERGWAHLSGLPSHRELRAIAETSDGYSSDAVPLRVEPLIPGVVDPLTVQEPATLLVDATIEESIRTRFPSARISSLSVDPSDPSRQTERMQKDASGKPVRFGPLHPGRWLVSCLVKVGGSWSPVELGDLELKAGETRTLEKKVTPNVFEGIVTSDGKGIAARIVVDDRDTTLKFLSDASGAFVAVLQRPGIYKVGVTRLSAQGNVMPVGDVAFTDPSRRIEIVMPKGASVSARVRMDDHPVPNTVVFLSSRDKAGLLDPMTSRGRATDAAGEATFDDLSPGVWTFSVRESTTRSGAEKSVRVEAGQRETVRLDLARSAGIDGTLRGLGGAPLVQARVDCLFTGPTGNPDRASAVSDADGTFSIQLIAPLPQFALCSIVGPGGQVDAARAIPAKRLDFTMPGTTGTLRISNLDKARDMDQLWLLTPDGRAVSLRAASMNLGQFGTTLTIPSLVTGLWKVIRLDSRAQWLALATGLGASLQSVAEITLRPGTTESIQLNTPLQPPGKLTPN